MVVVVVVVVAASTAIPNIKHVNIANARLTSNLARFKNKLISMDEQDYQHQGDFIANTLANISSID